MKLRNVRDRQWERHLQRLCQSGEHITATRGLERWYERKARRHNWRLNRQVLQRALQRASFVNPDHDLGYQGNVPDGTAEPPIGGAG